MNLLSWSRYQLGHRYSLKNYLEKNFKLNDLYNFQMLSHTEWTSANVFYERESHFNWFYRKNFCDTYHRYSKNIILILRSMVFPTRSIHLRGIWDRLENSGNRFYKTFLNFIFLIWAMVCQYQWEFFLSIKQVSLLVNIMESR